MPTVRVELRGSVQGVGFRWFARETARRLRLSGNVRNRPDGTVEIVVAGPHAQVQSFVDAMRVGPSGARVEEVTSHPVDDAGTLDEPFSITR